MVWFLLVPAAWITVVVYHFRNCQRGSDLLDGGCWPQGIDWAPVFFGAVIGTMVICGIASALAGLSGGIVNKLHVWRFKERYRRNLVAIRDKDGVSGRISGGLFLMAGYIESSPCYFYYEKMPDGSLRPGNVDADDRIRIYEENREDGQMVAKQHECPWWLSVLTFTEGSWRFDIHVPAGTVRRGFSV